MHTCKNMTQDVGNLTPDLTKTNYHLYIYKLFHFLIRQKFSRIKPRTSRTTACMWLIKLRTILIVDHLAHLSEILT